jgi:Anti-sigma-K factor rskA
MAPEPHELTGAYAADAIEDAVECQEFEQHLSGCADCRQEVGTLRETAAALALAAATDPPPALRSRVLDRVASTPQLPAGPQLVSSPQVDTGPQLGTSPHVDTSPQPAPGAPRRGGRWLAAAAAVIMVAGLGAGITGAVQLRQAERERASAEQILSIVSAPNARRITGSARGGGSVTVLVAGAQAVLLTTEMPALPADHAYQLWLVRPGKAVSAGLGPAGRSASGAWDRPVDGVATGDSIAISIEPRAGSRQPSTTPVAVLRV